jgi:TRAP-type C4-dicarboxylate transport system permease small subunit
MHLFPSSGLLVSLSVRKKETRRLAYAGWGGVRPADASGAAKQKTEKYELETTRETEKGQRNSGRVLKAISQIPEKVLLVILILTLLDMVLSVFTRYITGRAIYWAEEVGTFGLVWITMIGAGICVRKKSHFTMPTFISRFPPRVRYVVDLINHALITIFGVLLLITGVGITRESWTMLSPALEVNLAIINSASIVCGALIVIYGIGQMLDIIKVGSAASPEGHS